MELEDETLQQIAPVYDSIFRRVINELEKHDALKLPATTFFESLSGDFQDIGKHLSDGVLAAYLLGYDSARDETKQTANFAEDDDRAEKAGDLDLRFDVPPEEAIDYFKRKRIVTKKEFNKLSDEAKAASFYVSGIYKKDILERADCRELCGWYLENTFCKYMRLAWKFGYNQATKKLQ